MQKSYIPEFLNNAPILNVSLSFQGRLMEEDKDSLSPVVQDSLV